MLTKKQHKSLKDEYITLLKSVDRSGIDDLIAYLESTDFFKAPARCEHSCNFPGGLLLHSINTYRALKEKLTPGTNTVWTGVALDENITNDTLIIVSLLHDLGKIGMFEKTQKNTRCYDEEAIKAADRFSVKEDSVGKYIWKVENGYRYINESPFGGAGETAVIIAQRYLRLTNTEIKALRWHAGYGPEAYTSRVSDAFASTPLALALYTADMEATFIVDKNG